MNKFNSFHSDHISKFGYSNQSVSVNSVVDLKEFVVGIVGTTTTGGDVSSSITSSAVDNIPVFTDTSGKLLKTSTVSINTTGDIRSVNSISTNSHLNNTGNAGIQMSSGLASDITFNSDQYKGAGNVGKILSLDTNGKLIPITAPSSSSTLAGDFSDFRVKIQGQTEVSVPIYITKVGKMAHIAFPSLAPPFTATTDVVQISHADLQPDPIHLVKNFVASVPNDLTAVKMIGLIGSQYYLEYSKTSPWTVSSGAIHPHTLSYQTTTTTLASTGVWGSAYAVIVPTLTTPTLASDISNDNFKITTSSIWAAGYEGWRLFDENQTNPWSSITGTYDTTAPFAANATDSFNNGVSTINGSWMKITLDQEYKFNYYKMGQNSGAVQNPYDFVLYGSNDNTTFTSINTQLGYSLTGTTNTYNAAISVGTQQYRYIVLHVTKISGNAGQLDLRNMELGWI